MRSWRHRERSTSATKDERRTTNASTTILRPSSSVVRLPLRPSSTYPSNMIVSISRVVPKRTASEHSAPAAST